MKTLTALLALAAATNAHMLMRTPKPAGNPDNGPLSADGSDFPCKGIGSVASGEVNVMAVGVPNTLSFTGSAVHGGGSCQVSLASGTQVDKNTKWMVIHSIEGGCPANVAGNLPADPNGSGAAQFQFTIPDHPDLPAGQEYTLAWTWNNKIGNREFYMNCARVQLQGAQKKRYAPSNMQVSKRQQAPLPDMFVANLGNGCTTAEGIDVEYPNPGASLEVAPNANLGKPQGNCGAVGAANPGKGSPSSSAVASGTSAPAVSNPGSPAPSAPPSSKTFSQGGPPVSSSPGGNRNGNPGGQFTQSEGGVFATATDGATQPTATASEAPSAPAASSSAPVASSPAPVASSSAAVTSATSAPAPVATGTNSNPSSGGTCEEGAWECAADGTSFRRCGSGSWSAPIQMAAGTSCSPGTSMNLAYNTSGTNAKRDLRSHISRRRHNLHGVILS